MSVAKRSPTISPLTLKNPHWFAMNGGGISNGKDPKSIYDNDGFDIHGYDVNGLDRAGVSWEQYQDPNSKGRGGVKLYDSVAFHWAGTDILQMKSNQARILNSPEMMKKVEEIQILQNAPNDARAIARIETLKRELELFLESK